MPSEAFDRLPEPVKQEILRKRQEEAERDAATALKIARRAKQATVAGGALSALLAAMAINADLGSGAGFLVFAGSAGAGAWGARAIVLRRLDQLQAIAAFGGGAIFLQLLLLGSMLARGGGYEAGWRAAIMFLVWLFYLSLGPVLALWAEQIRQTHDGPF